MAAWARSPGCSRALAAVGASEASGGSLSLSPRFGSAYRVRHLTGREVTASTTAELVRAWLGAFEVFKGTVCGVTRPK